MLKHTTKQIKERKIIVFIMLIIKTEIKEFRWKNIGAILITDSFVNLVLHIIQLAIT